MGQRQTEIDSHRLKNDGDKMRAREKVVAKNIIRSSGSQQQHITMSNSNRFVYTSIVLVRPTNWLNPDLTMSITRVFALKLKL